MHQLLLLSTLLFIFAGCNGSPVEDGSTLRTPNTETPAISNESARELAIEAEKNRIREELANGENVTNVSFGVLRPAEAEVVDRNATDIVVAVTVEYSVTVDNVCSYIGNTTETRYRVSSEQTELIAVQQDVIDERTC